MRATDVMALLPSLSSVRHNPEPPEERHVWPAPPIRLTQDVFGVIEQLQRLDRREDIMARLALALSSVGVDFFALLFAAPVSDANPHGAIFSGGHEGWRRQTRERRYLEISPSIPETLKRGGPVYWHEMKSSPALGRPQQRFFHEAAEYGFHDGLSVPILHYRRRPAFLLSSGRELETSQSARAAVHVLALYAHQMLALPAADETGPAGTLSAREADCLSWAAQGKTDWEIGEILGISESTAHWHVEQAKRRLKVPTRIQAVVAAIGSGAIRV
jgi:LuxR family transcriptional regulator, quorum-sensing system regulator BjaR1